jgi:hypothetical protein
MAEGEMLRAIARTVSVVQAVASSSMKRVQEASAACAISPLRQPATATSSRLVILGARLGRSQIISAANSRWPTGSAGVPQSEAGASSGTPKRRSASSSMAPSRPTLPICAKATASPSHTVIRRLSDESAMVAPPVQDFDEAFQTTVVRESTSPAAFSGTVRSPPKQRTNQRPRRRR